MSIEEEYLKLEKDRTPYEDRAEECASLTIPSAFPDDALKGQDNLDREYVQGFGAILTNHLVGKLALTILPPSQPFFRLSATQEAMDAVSQNNPSAVYEIEKILAQKEEAALRGINNSDFRKSLYPALRLSVVTGNCFIEKAEDTYIVHNLRSFVVERDFKGTITKLIIMEKKKYDTLPEEITVQEPENETDDINLYTKVELVEGQYIITQEVLGQEVGKEEKLKHFEDKFIDVSWNRIDGENYARSFCEDYLGTLFVLNKMLKVLAEGISEGVKIVKMVNPNGMTSYEDYVDAGHGDVIIGQKDDVTTVQSDKTMDLKVAKDFVNEMKQELSRAFLVTGSSIRDSERTTAQEVALVANEVEASLGGIYTRTSGNVQRPLVKQQLKDIKVDTNKDIDIIITTGLQALGRNVELNKINTLIQELQMLGQVVGAERVAEEVNVAAISSAMVANSGVASKDFLYSEQQKQENAKMQQEKQMTEQTMGGMLPQAGSNAANQMMGGEQ